MFIQDPWREDDQPSGRFAIVVVQESTEAGPGLDRSLTHADVLIGVNDHAIQSLMISLGVVVGHEFLDGLTEMPFAKGDDLVQTLSLYAQDEALRVRIQIWAPRGQPDRIRAAVLEHSPETGRVQRVPIHDDVTDVAKEPINGIGQVTRHLLHPFFRGIGFDSHDLDFSGLAMNREKDVISDDAREGEHLHIEEV